MFSKFTLFVASAFALGVIAAPGGTPPPAGNPSNQCSTGALNCCDSTQNANSNLVQTLGGLIGIPVGQLTGQVGLGCTPISVVGASGVNCASQTACCSGNTFNSLVTVACTPINVNA